MESSVPITPAWSQVDHDLLIEVRTTLNTLANDVKNYNANNTALELRVRALENLNNKALGGWKTLAVVFAALSGISGLLFSALNYFSHLPK